MKKELLELNKEYTYAQMCEIFECEQKLSSNTNGRKSQLKEWETLCKIEKPKRGKYVILEIYEQQKEKIDNRAVYLYNLEDFEIEYPSVEIKNK